MSFLPLSYLGCRCHDSTLAATTCVATSATKSIQLATRLKGIHFLPLFLAVDATQLDSCSDHILSPQNARIVTTGNSFSASVLSLAVDAPQVASCSDKVLRLQNERREHGLAATYILYGTLQR